MNIVSEIRRQYGVELPIVHATLDEARREAQRNATYLLLYLHCPTHENTQTFLTDVLANPQLREVLKTRFVMFAASVEEAAGHRLANEMSATTFPFLAVFLKRQPLLKVKGLLGAEELLLRLRTTFDYWDGMLAEEVHLRHEREEKERVRREEEQRALQMEAIDRERIRQYEEREQARRARVEQQLREREALALRQREEEEAARRQKQEEALRRTRLGEMRAAALARLPAEPPADAEASTVAYVSLKSLRGTQHERRFYRRDRLCCLRDYAVTLHDYDGSDFRLVAGYPPRVLDVDTDATVGDVPALIPRAVVLMRAA
ncbi:UBX domain containing protein [Trypanosoma grayi]|uniref:UBX domain containing protein n=1 Tax=Trypanosoma grayi TaxID=71804 RepID=UPI0004F47AA3|nr:UBX domain containing protein [Trypanosoma grayi]KEG07915.1 UBX domain containing protein [Trypanosoma grayi]